MDEVAVYWSGWSLDGRIAVGFLPFVLLALIGLQLLARGVRGDISDWLGHASASRAWFLIGGIFLQLPLIAWIAFLVHQRWFEHLASP